MVWPGVGMSLDLFVEGEIALDDVLAPGGDDRQYRIGDPWHALRIFLLARGPMRKLAVGHDVARLGEGRHPAPVFQPGVPADMIAVQVRAHYVIDVADREPDSSEPVLETVAVHHVPERPRRPLLMIADAGIDQDIVVRRLDHEALDAKHELVGCVDEGRLQPRAVVVEQLLGERREESQHVEKAALLLDDRMNRDVLEHDRRWHRGYPWFHCRGVNVTGRGSRRKPGRPRPASKRDETQRWM